MSIFISPHAIQRYRERVGGKKKDEEIKTELELTIKQCKQPAEKLAKKGGIYRWCYFVPLNSGKAYAAVNEERDVCYTILTRNMFDNLKGKW